MVIEFDPTSYMVTEGADRTVRLIVVKRTITTRQVTVLFSTEGMSAQGILHTQYTIPLLSIFSVYYTTAQYILSILYNYSVYYFSYAHPFSSF